MLSCRMCPRTLGKTGTVPTGVRETPQLPPGDNASDSQVKDVGQCSTSDDSLLEYMHADKSTLVVCTLAMWLCTTRLWDSGMGQTALSASSFWWGQPRCCAWGHIWRAELCSQSRIRQEYMVLAE